MSTQDIYIRNHCLSIIILDVFRFCCLLFVILPLFADIITDSFQRSIALRIFTVLSAPQLILPVYTGAVAFGFAKDNPLKVLGIIMKTLALVPTVALLITFVFLIIQGTIQNGGIVIIIYASILIMLDIMILILYSLYIPESKRYESGITDVSNTSQ